uniref:Uncharacterized protein n=1 Tax=Tetranychus urticae TaxID=32264 RepID=T1JWY5_TETUR
MCLNGRALNSKKHTALDSSSFTELECCAKMINKIA